MTKFLVISEVALLLIMRSFLINSEEKEMDFCHSNLEFQSIFNLGDDTIFQDRFKNLWKLKTEIPGRAGQSFPLQEKKVLIDKKMVKVLDHIYDLDQPLFGFTAIDEDTAVCTNDTKGEFEECIDVNTDSNIHYSCFFGYNGSLETQRIEAFKYNYSELQEILSESLKKRIQSNCKNHSFDEIAKIPDTVSNNHIVGGLQYYEYDEQYNYTLLRRQILISPHRNESVVNMYAFYDEYEENARGKVVIKHKTYVSKIPFTTFVYVFRYNSNLGIFGCPLFCTLRTNLTRINIFKDKGKLSYHPVAVTIQDLIRCPNYKIWHPNEFCSQSGFHSAFNLGKDVVFQNQGKFWRYISTGSNNYGNPFLENKLQSIRFDSDLHQFLDQYFDTSRVIHGFTFKHENQDLCEGYKSFFDCNQHFRTFADLPYFRACVYGEEIYFMGNRMLRRERVEAFYYTPVGLRVFQSKNIAEETRRFCSKISKSLGGELRLTGILGDSFTNPDGVNDLYAFFKNMESDDVFYYKTTISTTFDMDGDLTWTLLSHQKSNQNGSLPVDSMNYLWFQNELIGLSSQNLSDSPMFDSMKDMASRYDWRSGTFKGLRKSIYSLYNCPFSQSYSVTYLEPEPICSDFTGVFSIFQIYRNVYYQKGRRFYRALLKETNRKLVFDKYFTDLMNDNFDTRYRVLGYSYPMDYQEHRVFIVGKSKNDTRSLGDKIFRAFSVGWSPFSPLEALNDPTQLYYSDITFGLTDPTLKYSRFKAMVYLDHGGFFRGSYEGPQQPLWLLMLVINETHLFYSADNRKFEFPFDDNFDNIRHKEGYWTALGLYQEKSPFSDIFGMFEYKRKVYAAAWPPGDSNRTMPIIVKVWDWRDSVNASFWLMNYEKHQTWDFDQYFNCGDKDDTSESVQSESHSGVPYLFIILVLLLILMGCVVGYIAWDRNSQTSDHKSDENTTPKDVEASNKSTKTKNNLKSVSQYSLTAKPQKSSDNKQFSKSVRSDSPSDMGSDDAKSTNTSVVQLRSNIGD